MGNKLLITEALDERQLLVKKIRSKIDTANFLDVKKCNEEKVLNGRISEEEFKRQAEASYQQILDLIERYQKIDAAIIVSNATTWIETSYGTFTVAEAISLRNRLRESIENQVQIRFEKILETKMEIEYKQYLQIMENKNKVLNETAENMRLSILGKENRGKEEKPLEVVNAYVKENTTELIDPLGILHKIEESKLKRVTLLSQLETKIKVSNATTYIEV